MSLQDDGVLPADAVEVARVLGAWGIKGGIRLKPFAAQPEALLASRRWWLQPGATALTRPPSVAAAQPALPRLLHVEQVRAQGDALVATCRELTQRDAAERLAGARVFVPRECFPPAEEGEFYWVDLIGLQVVNRAGQPLGQVTHLVQTGPQSVLCVQPAAADAPELLIPFVDAYVDRVDRAQRRILVDWELDF